jgi:1,4-alpha-glucan branching enzyme
LSNALYWLKNFTSTVCALMRSRPCCIAITAPARRIASQQVRRREGIWKAIDFIHRFNELAHQEPGAITIAEESTSWPGVSASLCQRARFHHEMEHGWMHDMLDYFGKRPRFSEISSIEHYI